VKNASNLIKFFLLQEVYYLFSRDSAFWCFYSVVCIAKDHGSNSFRSLPPDFERGIPTQYDEFLYLFLKKLRHYCNRILVTHKSNPGYAQAAVYLETSTLEVSFSCFLEGRNRSHGLVVKLQDFSKVHWFPSDSGNWCFKEIEFMQKRRPVGVGPSSKTCPRCESQ
jgi:hypothetical protein